MAERTGWSVRELLQFPTPELAAWIEALVSLHGKTRHVSVEPPVDDPSTLTLPAAIAARLKA